MRNKLISIIALCMSFSLLTGCGSAQAKDSGSEEPAVNTADSAQEVTEDAEQDTPEVTQQAGSRRRRGHVHRYLYNTGNMGSERR